jgi:dephospho-CoA kinase
MLIVGLTGSIGMGKSTAAARFRAHGIPVSDADQIVHDLYERELVPAIESAFPGSTSGGRVDRPTLARSLAGDREGFRKLEGLVHPMVRQRQKAFLAAALHDGHAMAVLEIPLLFETGGHERVDVTVVMSAPPDVQARRVLERPGMTREALAVLLARQMPDADKRARADFVVDTDRPVAETAAAIDQIIASLEDREGLAYHRCWADA